MQVGGQAAFWPEMVVKITNSVCPKLKQGQVYMYIILFVVCYFQLIRINGNMYYEKRG